MTQPRDMGNAFLRFVHEALGSLAAPTVRDSVMYSILAVEWPDVRRHLEGRLARYQVESSEVRS